MGKIEQGFFSRDCFPFEVITAELEPGADQWYTVLLDWRISGAVPGADLTVQINNQQIRIHLR